MGITKTDLKFDISIHAPHAGCDCQNIKEHTRRQIFQSTHPMRGATLAALLALGIALISIHAPHAGCDIYIGAHADDAAGFQSTHPMRGATTLPIPL